MVDDLMPAEQEQIARARAAQESNEWYDNTCFILCWPVTIPIAIICGLYYGFWYIVWQIVCCCPESVRHGTTTNNANQIQATQATELTNVVVNP
jgi:hypothetical protein